MSELAAFSRLQERIESRNTAALDAYTVPVRQ
jgi:hypothetical protein